MGNVSDFTGGAGSKINAANERAETQPFWLDILAMLGATKPSALIQFEKPLPTEGKTKRFADAWLPATRVLIEQKSRGINLDAREKQSDGALLTPYQQAKRYAAAMPVSERPKWIVVCNFTELRIHDEEKPYAPAQVIFLKNLERDLYRLNILVDPSFSHIKAEEEVSREAGRVIGKLYNLLLKQYSMRNAPAGPEPITNGGGGDAHSVPQNAHSLSERQLRSLNILCVRLVFLLYAEDAGIFKKRDLFGLYMEKVGALNARNALIELFRVLDTPLDQRNGMYLNDDLAAFPYVNGGLFAPPKTDNSGAGPAGDIEIPNFTEEVWLCLVYDCSLKFDWSGISPTIFGAVFESTLSAAVRRSGGMHYTSVENIHKVIDPLFLDALRNEFESIRNAEFGMRNNSGQQLSAKGCAIALRALQTKISNLKFLDPACGSGNFLTETYISLRRLENDILRALRGEDTQIQLGFGNAECGMRNSESGGVIKVSISQFYGIEINDFAVTVAKTALWIAEAQMMMETEDIVQAPLSFLPLKNYSGIAEGNALRMDWSGGARSQQQGSLFGNEDTLWGKGEARTYDYIIGNPPFVGARMKSKEQANDLLTVFGKDWKNIGNIDYVGAWYKKAADLMRNSPAGPEPINGVIRANKCGPAAAFVSTKSICQGGQVADLWKPLFKDIQIDFAYKNFKWESESFSEAAVVCVIVGFSARRMEGAGLDVTLPARETGGAGMPNNVGANDYSPLQTARPGRFIVGEDSVKRPAKNINAYLIDGPDVFVETRQRPICDVPEMGVGCQIIDNGNYVFTLDEKNDFVSREPKSEKFFRTYYGGKDYLYNTPRYALCLGGCTPQQLKDMPLCLERVERVRQFRAASKRQSTRRAAETPHKFASEVLPDGYFVVLPRTTGERREYVPFGFMSPDNIVADSVQLIQNATKYHFSVLSSHVHMAWMRVICGRLGSSYIYSAGIVYNNFPWPPARPTPETKADLEKAAQEILDARAKYPESSLAALYDPLTMPTDLRAAHKRNDALVMKAYGFALDITESEIVGRLLEMRAGMA